MPGFGCARPEGFGATKDDYVDWLVGELDGIEGPIDLVGHDWGALLTLRVATAHGARLRSWATDTANLLHPDYVWHDFARIWQTPEAGEQAIAGMLAAPMADRVAQYTGLGMTPEVARSVAEGTNEAMGRCILTLYRSAAQPAMAELGACLPQAAVRPGLVIIATEDHFTGGELLARRSAERAGAKVAMLPGLGHWWMCQDPKAGAAVLKEFFATL